MAQIRSTYKETGSKRLQQKEINNHFYEGVRSETLQAVTIVKQFDVRSENVNVFERDIAD